MARSIQKINPTRKERTSINQIRGLYVNILGTDTPMDNNNLFIGYNKDPPFNLK
jgi:hypothetical protein